MIAIGDQIEWVEKKLEHIRYEYDLKPGDYCLDIGSYRMEWATEIIKRYGCRVECFDALDNRAAWVYDGTIKMGGAFYYTSMFDNKGEQEFNCVDIAPYLEREIAIMKMNIEGGEYYLLKYIISKRLHTNIKNIQVQFHEVGAINYKKLYEEIKKELEKTHTLTWKYDYVWENWERI